MALWGRTVAGGARTAFAVGDWLVEPELNRISTSTQSVYLRRQLMDVLVYLAGQQGKVATLETLHDDLWHGKVVSSGTIYNCIADLRQALARDGKNVEYIETIPKTGYRLKPPVVTRPGLAAPGDGTAASVAILPLANRSGDPQLDYLCEGIADEVLHRLKQLEGLRVFSAFTLSKQDLDPRVVGLRFGAGTVLAGSLQKSGQQLRLTFRLDGVESGESLWSGRFDHPVATVLDVEEAVAQQVANALRPALGLVDTKSVVLTRNGAKSLDALNAFLLGKHALSRETEQSFDEAIRYFEKAISLDPTFARAHYRLYLACHRRRRYHGDAPLYLDKARKAAATARALGFKAPVPWTHIERRLYPDRRPDTNALALEAIDWIRNRDPDWWSFGHEQLTWVLPAFGLFRATLDFARHMFDSPSQSYEDSDADEELPNYHAAVGEFDEAIRLWSSEVQKDPERLLFRYERSVLYSRTGQFEYAASDIASLDDGQFRQMALAFYHLWRGEIAQVAECHRRLLGLPSLHPSYLVFTSCMLEDMDEAAEYYAQAVNLRARSFIDLGPLRAMARGRLPAALNARLEQHPRFQALLVEHGVTPERRVELIERLNAISAITGIVVEPDEESSVPE